MNDDTKPAPSFIEAHQIAGPANVNAIAMLIEEGRLHPDRFYWSGNVLFCDPKYAERIRAVLRRRLGAAAVLDIPPLQGRLVTHETARPQDHTVDRAPPRASGPSA